MRWRFNGEISFTYSTLQQILRRSFYRWSHKQAAAAATALLVAEKRIEIRGEKGECTVRTQTHTHIHIRICISLSLTLAHLVESHQSLLRTAFVVVFVILSVLIEHCFILQYFTYTYTHSYTYRLQSLNKACLYHFWLTFLPICCCPQIRLSLNLIRLAVCASYPYLLTGSPPSRVTQIYQRPWTSSSSRSRVFRYFWSAASSARGGLTEPVAGAARHTPKLRPKVGSPEI